jgi:hypothetical protein
MRLRFAQAAQKTSKYKCFNMMQILCEACHERGHFH